MRVVKCQPEALVQLLVRDETATALQDAFDAADAVVECALVWCSFTPLKRGFAVSMSHSHSLALKYAEKLEVRFASLDEAIRRLDQLQQRLPVCCLYPLTLSR